MPEPNAVLRLQASHRSIRRYTGEPIPEALLAELIRAGQGAASSSFIQAYSVIRVTRSAGPPSHPGVKPRLPLELVLHQDRYQDGDPAAIADYDRVMADYYRARGNNARRSDWSATTARAVQGKKREHLLPFLQRLEFFRR
jgi:hypothetical protein